MLKDLARLYELYSKFLFSSSIGDTSTTDFLSTFVGLPPNFFAYLVRTNKNY